MKRYTIGRGEQNDIIIADQTVSRQHAELEEIGSGKFILKDLGSTFGSRIVRDGEWLDILEIEVGDDTQIGLGEYETTIGGLLTAQQSSDEATGPDEPEPEPVPASEPTPAPKAAQAGFPGDFFKNNLLWIVLGGVGFVLVVGVGVALGLYLQPGQIGSAVSGKNVPRTTKSPTTLGSTTLRTRLMASCMQSARASSTSCSCRLKILYKYLNAKELEVLLDIVENKQNATKMRALPVSQRTALQKKLGQVTQEFLKTCRRK